MIFTNTKEALSLLLTKIAKDLDIPDYLYEDATLKYEDISSWLGAEDSGLLPYSPGIYPQGSFRLGTVVHPISPDEGFDIDLVCNLELDKEKISQEDLRQMIGDRLKKRDDLAKMLKELGRCWRLNYPAVDSTLHFHMDILPAIPNRERPPTGILLSDTDLFHWQKSNPKAYAEWFYEQMRNILLEKRMFAAKSLEADIEEVPEWQVKTPLQIAIQILKRHRDIYFQDDPKYKPISIIITTLAALVYKNQADVYDALIDIVRDMPSKIECRDGKWWVENPVDPDENFAEKWNIYPECRESFESWLKKVQDDFSVTLQQYSLTKAVYLFESTLGERTTATVASELGLKPSSDFVAPAIKQIQVPTLANTSHCQVPPWPEQLRYKAKVTCSVSHIEFGKKLWELTDRSVPKNVGLRFKVQTNTPAPYSVKWQVVNTGKEATDAVALRGDFYESAGTDTRWETTSYKGTHWVEAFIIKDGDCVAKSGRKMVRVR